MDYGDNELISLFKDNNDDAKDVLFEKYSYIIDIILAKYKKALYALNIDINEARQEANLAFADALIKYASDKDSSLPTFISLVVERKIQNCVRKGETLKNKIINEAYSLDYEYDAFKRPLLEIIGDNTNDPLKNMADEEGYNELVKKIDGALSPFEHDVYSLLINGFNYREIAKILNKEDKQIDNTIQRLRTKIKDLI